MYQKCAVQSIESLIYCIKGTDLIWPSLNYLPLRNLLGIYKRSIRSLVEQTQTLLRGPGSQAPEMRITFLWKWGDTKLEFIEQFKVMLTNRVNKFLGIFGVSTGGVSGTAADPN